MRVEPGRFRPGAAQPVAAALTHSLPAAVLGTPPKRAGVFNDRELSLVCQTPKRVKLQSVLNDVVAGIATALPAFHEFTALTVYALWLQPAL